MTDTVKVDCDHGRSIEVKVEVLHFYTMDHFGVNIGFVCQVCKTKFKFLGFKVEEPRFGKPSVDTTGERAFLPIEPV